MWAFCAVHGWLCGRFCFILERKIFWAYSGHSVNSALAPWDRHANWLTYILHEHHTSNICCGVPCFSCIWTSHSNWFKPLIYRSYPSTQGICLPCSEPCYSCVGPSHADCSSCTTAHFLLSGQCLTHCPTGHYAEQDVCYTCHHTCHTCTGKSYNTPVSHTLCHRSLCRPRCVLHLSSHLSHLYR